MLKLMCCVVIGALMATVPGLAEPVSDTNMEILKEKLKADKKLLIAGNMDLTDREAKQFWSIYEAYQKDLEAINKQLGQTITTYAEAIMERFQTTRLRSFSTKRCPSRSRSSS